MALCAAGYRVLMPNVRGSTTFGGDWVRALSARWGTVDAEDALASVDALIERGLADPQRLGLMGLSYGGSNGAAQRASPSPSPGRPQMMPQRTRCLRLVPLSPIQATARYMRATSRAP